MLKTLQFFGQKRISKRSAFVQFFGLLENNTAFGKNYCKVLANML
jgi:hypothetical protein